MQRFDRGAALRGDELWVDEPEGKRWLAAVEVLAEGGYVVCMGLGLTFRRQEPGPPGASLDETLHVRVESQWEPSANLTSAKAEAQLRNAEAGVAEIRRKSPEFEGLVRDRVIDYELIHTYGMGAIRLALRPDGFRFLYKP